jgi:small subunit ribosomal protein S6
MNIEVNQETLRELENAFRFNDAVIRNLIIGRKGPPEGSSRIYEEELREQEKDREREQRRGQEQAARASEGDASDEQVEVAEDRE